MPFLLSGDFMPFLQRWRQVAPDSEEGWMFPSIVTGKPYRAGILLDGPPNPLGRANGRAKPWLAHLPTHFPQLT
jgi:hypothetical protein